MNPHSTKFTKAPHLGAIGLQPYESRNIRLSSALCAFGFELRINSEPATVVINYDTQQPVVVFWHDMMLPEDSKIHKQLPALTANHLGLWWMDPKQFSVEGYDDALRAIRTVFEAREWLIGVAKGMRNAECGMRNDGRMVHGSVTTESLHIASVIKASGIRLIAFDKRTRGMRNAECGMRSDGTFIFGKEAAPIAALIDSAENGKSSTRAENQKVAANSEFRIPNSEFPIDACVDWMLAALKYRDWLHRIVRSKNCIPMIEKRDGERCLRVSIQMPKTLRREFTRRF